MTKVILALSLSVAVGGMAGCSTPTPEKQTASQPVMSHKSLPASSQAGRKDTRKETRQGTTTRQTPPTSPVPSETDPTIAPDDTGRNVRDREAKRLTPMDQSSDP